MSLGKYLILMSLATLICWACFIMVLIFINPMETGNLGFFFFYSSLAVSLIGTFSLCGFLLRFWFKKEQLVYHQINIASRQSVLLTVLILSLLMLQSQSYLTWLNLVLVLVGISMIEFFLIAYNRSNR